MSQFRKPRGVCTWTAQDSPDGALLPVKSSKWGKAPMPVVGTASRYFGTSDSRLGGGDPLTRMYERTASVSGFERSVARTIAGVRNHQLALGNETRPIPQRASRARLAATSTKLR